MMSSSPATMSLITIRKQKHAGAASGGFLVLQFALGAVFVICTPRGVARLGLGPFMTVVFACGLLAALVAAWSIAVDMRDAARRGDLYAPGPKAGPARGGDGGGGGAAGSSEDIDLDLIVEVNETGLAKGPGWLLPTTVAPPPPGAQGGR
jgi:hypothetical protein